MNSKAVAVTSIVISMTSLVVGMYSLEGIMITASVFALFYSTVAFMRGHERIYNWSLLMSIIIAVCTVLTATVASYENLVETGSMTRDEWTYISCLIHAVPVIPLTLMTYFILAAVFNASYNWTMVSGLSVFIGLGISVPGYVSLYAVQRADIDAGLITNAYVLFSLMISLIQLVIFAVILYHIFRKKGYIITSNGLETIL